MTTFFCVHSSLSTKRETSRDSFLFGTSGGAESFWWMMMHTTPNGRIIWYFFFSFLTLFSFEKRRGRPKKKSYDPVYVACLIKKRKGEGRFKRTRTPSQTEKKKFPSPLFFCKIFIHLKKRGSGTRDESGGGLLFSSVCRKKSNKNNNQRLFGNTRVRQ